MLRTPRQVHQPWDTEAEGYQKERAGACARVVLDGVADLDGLEAVAVVAWGMVDFQKFQVATGYLP